MNENDIIEELFCTNFEVKNLSDILIYGKAERWVYGFMPKRYEDEHLNRYKHVLKYVSNKKVLDVACGCGYGTYLLAKEGNAQSVVGVDLSADAVRYGNHRYSHPNTQRFVADATKFNYENLFDIIVSFETIEHIPNYDDFVNNVYKNLNRDGLLFISTPITKHTNSHPVNPYHVIEWNFHDFHKLFEDKFEIIEILLQEVKIQSEPKRKEYTIKNRFLNRLSKEKLSTIRGGEFEKFVNQYDMTLCNEGYQTLVLKKI